jgi:hypothetical protein
LLVRDDEQQREITATISQLTTMRSQHDGASAARRMMRLALT